MLPVKFGVAFGLARVEEAADSKGHGINFQNKTVFVPSSGNFDRPAF
jgi:hypothetical protein